MRQTSGTALAAILVIGAISAASARPLPIVTVGTSASGPNLVQDATVAEKKAATKSWFKRKGNQTADWFKRQKNKVENKVEKKLAD